MNKKGFTLIELLAVIVILAIIALIATPIILGIINEARDSAKARSAELVYSGVEYGYVTAMYKSTNGVGITDPTLTDIKNYMKFDNVKDSNITLDNDTNPTKITIVTDDGVTCEVTNKTEGYEVKCGDYLTKVIPTDGSTTGGESTGV